MHPQCRYLRPGGQSCRAIALKGSEWCYHHARLHRRYRAQTARQRLHKQRDASGRFTPAHHHAAKDNHMDTRPGQPSRPHPAPADPGLAAAAGAETGAPSLNETWDYGANTCGDNPRPRTSHTHQLRHPDPEQREEEGPAVHPPLNLPPIADSASIQHALTGILQALAANQLDPKRAGVLLYGLQVASTHAKPTQARPAGTQQATPVQPPAQPPIQLPVQATVPLDSNP